MRGALVDISRRAIRDAPAGAATTVDGTTTRDAHRPRILHLVPSDGIGGVEVAATSMRARSDLPCHFRLLFIEPAVLPGSRWRRTIALMRAHAGALREAMAFRPDVIVGSLWRSVPLWLTLRVLRPRARFVYFLHFDRPVHALDAALSARAIGVADQVWGDSAATLAARGIDRARGRVISFVTERASAPTKAFAGPRFVSWGRLHPQKGFDRAIELIRLLVDRGIDARYAIHGPDAGERAALLALVARLGLEDRVRLAGPLARADLPRVAADASFFLQLSRSEGMCMAAVEAMQLGLVPVATAVGEMARYVVRSKTGVVADPARLDAAAEDLAGILADASRWHALSAGAVRYWRRSPLYADDVCAAAAALV